VKAYQGDGLSFIVSNPAQQETKNVKFDGKDYPQGPDAGSSSSIRPVDEHTLEMTDKYRGKVTNTSRLQAPSSGLQATGYRLQATGCLLSNTSVSTQNNPPVFTHLYFKEGVGAQP
jgi:hypothetical protein